MNHKWPSWVADEINCKCLECGIWYDEYLKKNYPICEDKK